MNKFKVVESNVSFGCEVSNRDGESRVEKDDKGDKEVGNILDHKVACFMSMSRRGKGKGGTRSFELMSVTGSM